MGTRASESHRWSLGVHLTWVVLLALVPALVIQYASSLDRRREARNRAEARAMHLVGNLASRQEQITAVAQQWLTTLAQLPQVQHRDGAGLTPILRALRREDPRFTNLFALDAEGRAFAVAVPGQATSAVDRKYFREAQASRRFTVGEFTVGRNTGFPTLHFSLPVLDQAGRVQTVLVAAYHLNHYQELFDRSGLPPGTTLTLLDHQGTVLFHLAPPGQAPALAVGGSLPLQTAQLPPGDGTGRAFWVADAGQRSLVAVQPVTLPGNSHPYLFVLASRPEAQVLAASLARFRRDCVLLGLSGLLPLGAAWIMGRLLIVAPVRRLVRASRRIGAGQLEARPVLRTASREVAELAAEFEAMSTSLARREVAQQRAQDTLHTAHRMESLSRLAGGIAHEFNNLLTVILGNLNLARPLRPVASAADVPLERAEAAVIKASDLARQLLVFSGKGHLVVRPHDLNAVVEEMTHLLRMSIAPDHALGLDLGRDLPGVRVDAAQIQQVLLHLVVNASEALGAEAGSITLRTSSVVLDAETLANAFPSQNLAAGPYLTLEVVDTGCGMAPELMARIFEPFFSTKPGGQGLGLSALHGILKAHQGGLKVESEPGRGSAFRLYFPVTPASDQPNDLEDSGQNTLFLGTVLVADDEPMVREFAAAAFASFGFHVVEAMDGAEAVAQFKAQPEAIRLAFLDRSMPRLDGLQAFTALRALRPDLPIILSSGYDQDAEAQRLMDEGQGWFLPKPYQVRELRRMVAKALGGSLKAPGPSTPGA
jgi:signal transduction histidine kinase/CheY-like chemotaxis protein